MATEAVARLSASDRALLLAIAAWGRHDGPGAPAALGDDWRGRLAGASSWVAARIDTAAELLRAEHAASIRFDPAHVHPSWFARALREESPAVRRAVLAHAPGAIAGTSADDPGPASPGRTPHPGALACALALWSERLVGGPPATDDDAPVVIVLTRLGSPALTRMLRYSALAKLAYALGGLELGETGGLKPGDRARLDAFRRLWGDVDPPMVRFALADLDAGGHASGRDLPRLGLVTVAQLLRDVDPHRARWALQHLPYGVANQVRQWMRPGNRDRPPEALIAWESQILDAAIDRLRAEGRDSTSEGLTPEDQTAIHGEENA